MKPSKIQTVFLLLSFLLGLGCTHRIQPRPQPPISVPTGPAISISNYSPVGLSCSGVSVLNTDFDDSTRGNKNIKLRLRLPTGCSGNNFPIVIYSHGGDYSSNFGNNKGRFWGATVASAGYVVIHISHEAPLTSQEAVLCSKFNMTTAVVDDTCADSVTSPTRFLKLSRFERTADALAVIKELLTTGSTLQTTITGALPPGSIVDFDNIGVMGFSAGSQVPLTLAGASRKLDGSTPYKMIFDPDLKPGSGGNAYGRGLILANTLSSIKAGVALSPQGIMYNDYYCGSRVRGRAQLGSVSHTNLITCNTTDNSFHDIDFPLLIATGSQDNWHRRPNNIDPLNRRLSFDLISPTKRRFKEYLLYVGNNGGPSPGGGAANPGANHPFFNFLNPPRNQMASPALALMAAVIARFDSRMKSTQTQVNARALLNQSPSQFAQVAKSHPHDISSNPPNTHQTVFVKK